MSSREFKGIKIECIQGDISNQPDMDAVVNAANAQLRRGGGVAGAIHRAAGPKLEEECLHLAPIKPGQAVITRGYNLPNRYVIHCLGPVYGRDEPSDLLLADCYRNALGLAEQHRIETIGFPAISTGVFGYPLEAAAEVALNTVCRELPQLKSVRQVRFVLFSEKDQRVHAQILENLSY